MERVIVIPYTPRVVFKPYHNRVERWAVLVAHRRCGKTVACVNDLIKRAITLTKDHGRYAYVAPFLAQAKEVAWEYLKRYALPITKDKNEAELWVELINGARIRIHGADNPDRLRGAYLDGVVADEFADMRPSVWGEVIRPMLADREGWATFIGTPKGKNEFWDIYERAKGGGWYSVMLKASETGLLPAHELEDARRDMTPEQYEQEFECSFDAAILGAYFGKEMAEAMRAGRIKPHIPVEPELPVHTAWDIGKGDHMAIWCWQSVANEIRVVDFLQSYGYDMVKYCADLDLRGYHGTDYVPHDAKVPSMETGKTRIETLIKLGRKPKLVADHYVEDGINATRVEFKRFWFSEGTCKEGMEALRQYRADYDEKTKSFKLTPKADWSTHAADAFRYLAMAYRQERPPEVKPKGRILSVGELNQVTLEDMWPKRSGHAGRI